MSNLKLSGRGWRSLEREIRSSLRAGLEAVAEEFHEGLYERVTEVDTGPSGPGTPPGSYPGFRTRQGADSIGSYVHTDGLTASMGYIGDPGGEGPRPPHQRSGATHMAELMEDGWLGTIDAWNEMEEDLAITFINVAYASTGQGGDVPF